jgi:type II secretory pathway pseudopilin PulG
MNKTVSSVWKKLSGFKYALLVGVLGLALLLWPSGSSQTQAEADTEEARLAALLTQIEGVGQADVLLSDSGAVVVCPGGDQAAVRLKIAQAVRCYTGLGADKVEIFKTE